MSCTPEVAVVCVVGGLSRREDGRMNAPPAGAHLQRVEQRLPEPSKLRNEPWAWALLGSSQGLGTGSQISPISEEKSVLWSRADNWNVQHYSSLMENQIIKSGLFQGAEFTRGSVNSGGIGSKLEITDFKQQNP